MLKFFVFCFVNLNYMHLVMRFLACRKVLIRYTFVNYLYVTNFLIFFLIALVEEDQIREYLSKLDIRKSTNPEVMHL